jgi:chorismate mutase
MSTEQSEPSVVRALRGATTVDEDRPGAIVEATEELISALLEGNGIATADVISMIFTSTADIASEFPAAAARRLGMSQVPLLCSVEIEVPGSLARCIRVLVHFHTTKPPDELRHVYLRAARSLRSDLDL